MWGMYYGILLIIEKFMIGDRLEKVPGMCRHLYSLLFVMIGWVFFFSPTLGFAWKYLGVMFGVGAKTVVDSMGIYLLITNLALFAIAAVGSTAKVHEIFGRIVYGGYKVRAVLAWCDLCRNVPAIHRVSCDGNLQPIFVFQILRGDG